MRLLFVVFVGSLLIGCDTVTSHYDDMEEAKADRLFERGWLPNILPDSSVDIVTSNDLDLNYSTGHFAFDVEDGPLFYAQLSKGLPTYSRRRDWNEIVRDFPKDGHSHWWFENERATWAFFCVEEEGRCKYYAW